MVAHKKRLAPLMPDGIDLQTLSPLSRENEEKMSTCGPKSKVKIIAEAGVNHNGNLQTALDLVDAAAQAGADMVKFQTFNAHKVASLSAQKANYQMQTSDANEGQLEMLTRLQLSEDAHHALRRRCDEKGISFLSTAGEVDSLHFLTKDLQLELVKLGSGEVTNAPLLLEAARSGVKLILSTGMSTLSELEVALGVLAFGYLCTDGQRPSRSAFENALLIPGAFEVLGKNVSLMQCTTEYPSHVEDSNLRAMDTLRNAFGLEVGYSDHCQGNSVSIAAVSRGATIVEKHFTLDRSMQGPDHAASIEPDEFRELVVGIRQVELALGSGIKIPSETEQRNRSVVRRSVVAVKDLHRGQVLSLDDITIKRPGTGISPIDFWDCAGKKLLRDINKDGLITRGDLE